MAFGRLVSKYQGRIMAIAYRLLRHRADAEDVVQEVFTRAWIAAPAWRSPEASRATYAAWLSRVAVNAAIDRQRKIKPLPLDDAADPADPALNPEATVLASEQACRVRAAIASLPERQLTALSLTYDAELSNQDGAAAMKTSVGAFELLLVRARRALRLSLTEAGGDGSD